MILHGISEFIGNAFTEVLLYFTPEGAPGRISRSGLLHFHAGDLA
jgi:hypothetical protein